MKIKLLLLIILLIVIIACPFDNSSSFDNSFGNSYAGQYFIIRDPNFIVENNCITHSCGNVHEKLKDLLKDFKTESSLEEYLKQNYIEYSKFNIDFSKDELTDEIQIIDYISKKLMIYKMTKLGFGTRICELKINKIKNEYYVYFRLFHNNSNDFHHNMEQYINLKKKTIFWMKCKCL